jgi:hypothetical protein
MIITIDTSKDRKEDILAAIAALQRLVNDASPPVSSEIPEEGAAAFGSMFGDDAPKTEPDDDDSPPGSVETY